MDICEPVRGHVFGNAIMVAAEDRQGGNYPDVPSEADVIPLIEEYILALGKLHGMRDHPLRYPAPPNQKAPRMPFLVRTLGRVADDLVKRPSDFELARFVGKA